MICASAIALCRSLTVTWSQAANPSTEKLASVGAAISASMRASKVGQEWNAEPVRFAFRLEDREVKAERVANDNTAADEAPQVLINPDEGRSARNVLVRDPV